MSLQKIDRLTELEDLLKKEAEIKLYGAGHYLHLFLEGIEEVERNYLEKIRCIIVTDPETNPKRIRGIPVCAYHETAFKPDEYILLTLGHRYTEEIYSKLSGTGAKVIQMDFNMFQRRAYEEVKESVQPLLDRFLADDPVGMSGLNEPEYGGAPDAIWTCWWQGEDTAPEIVRACWESQKRYAPEGVRHIIITAENYTEYITLPGHILAKVKSGHITLATLSDIIRATLLYRYGGFWMDATLFVRKPLDTRILDDPIYTRNLPETQYCADAMWAGWFLFAKPGNRLFRFVMEGFFHYFSVSDQIKHYFMIDYLIAIACNTFPEVESQLHAVPYNNEKALELGKHLKEAFSKERYESYVKDTCIQKLSYKLDWRGTEEKGDSIYGHIINLMSRQCAE